MLAKKVIFGFLVISLIFGLNPSFAQTTDSTSSSEIVEQIVSQTGQVDNLLQVSEQDFANIKTGWFNNLWRDIRIVFTFNPVKKADLELEKATAVLLKTKKELAAKELDPEKIKSKIEKASQRYEKAMQRASQRLEKYKQTHPNDQKLEKFLDKYTDFAFKHQLVFKELEDNAPQKIRQLVEQKRKAQMKRFIQAMDKVETPAKFKYRFKKILIDKDSKFERRVMRARLLEEVQGLDLDEQTKEKINEVKDEIKPLWEEFHQAYQQTMEKRQAVIEKLKEEAEENKDKLLNDPQARREFIHKVNQEMKSLREENREIYKEKREKVREFIEEHKDDLLEIKNEVKPLMKAKYQNQINSRTQLRSKIKPKPQLKNQASSVGDKIQVNYKLKPRVKSRLEKDEQLKTRIRLQEHQSDTESNTEKAETEKND